MSSAKVLIVEDEGILALHSKQQLEKLGYNVVGVAADGATALKKIADLLPDLVLMDIHIAGKMDGIETAALIPEEHGVAVVYLTAYSEESTLERARATKPYGYLIKPYSERELHATIQMALERRRANAAVADSEHRFRAMFDSVSEGIFILDAVTAKFIQVNAPGAAMLGYTIEELVGNNVAALSSGVPPYTDEGAAAMTASLATSGTPMRVNWQSKTKSGRVFPTEVSMRFASIGGRNVVLAIVRDLSDRMAMEEQLRQSQKLEAIGQLTGGMAHDFNNLLSVIVGNLDLLRDLKPDDEEVKEFAGEALDAALSGADLTRRLLAFARKQPLQPQHVDLNDLVARTGRLLKRLLGEDIEVEVTSEPGPHTVLVDPAQLEAALTNLATNARDAMPRGGKLRIATGSRRLDTDYVAINPEATVGDYAMVEVTDTGSGMPPEVISHIFEPFYTTKERDKGTGLGLSMVFGFLKQSGGHVTVYSEVGVGTTFRLYLPRVEAREELRQEESLFQISEGSGELILVVEDNPALRRIVVRQLQEFGYHVLDVSSAGAALEIIESDPIDMLFSDIVMPGGMDGYELALAAREVRPDIKVLLTSGYPESRLKGELVGADFPLLSKPYTKSDFERTVREILDGGGAGVGPSAA